MHARSDPPHHQSRLASGRRILAPPPGLDLRYGKNSNPCVNRFQSNFLSELVLHYTGGPLRNSNYSVNNLNQYSSRGVPGFVNVIGSAKTNATVSLWTPDGWWAPTIRHSDYYQGELAVNNSTGALWLSITNLAVLGNGASADITTNTVGNLFLPKNQEVFGYDLDGNLISDGRWNYTWDAENRLTRMVANTVTGPQQRLDFEYDSKSRRIRKKVWNNTAGTETPATDLTFVYDGWNLVGELSPSHAVVRTYLWGLDLSGTIQGAVGIAGLIELNDVVNGIHFVAFDGNGNAAALAKASDGTASASYEYGPFGELLRATGPVWEVNPFRFSTRYCDDESGIVVFPMRPYIGGRFLTRDPVGDEGFVLTVGRLLQGADAENMGNLYRFVLNNPLSHDDGLGLWPSQYHVAGLIWWPVPKIHQRSVMRAIKDAAGDDLEWIIAGDVWTDRGPHFQDTKNSFMHAI